MTTGSLAVLAGLAGVAATSIGVGIATYFARRSDFINGSTYVSQWFRDFRAWASEAVDVITRAIYCADDSNAKASTLAECRHGLSALVERGRFFLANERTKEYGIKKLPAYRGYRHAALGALVAAEKVLGGELGTFPSARSALEEMRKHFVSTIQKILDPARECQRLAHILHATFPSEDPTFGGLLPDPHSIPPGASSLLNGPLQSSIRRNAFNRPE